jgi:hypothetical protein
MEETNYKKNFKYSLKSKDGKIILQSIVSFGSKEYPFPKDWENNGMAQRSMFDYKEEFINRHFDLTIEEGDELDDFDGANILIPKEGSTTPTNKDDGCKFK